MQDPQEDNIRNAKDLILLAPDSMEYYREQKQQEDEKAKREQAIADACARQKQAQWEAKKQELEKKVKDFQEYDRLQQTDLRKEQDEKMKDILKDIEDAVQAYSKKEGYTMVFNDRVLVFQDKRLDITDEVMKILDKDK